MGTRKQRNRERRQGESREKEWWVESVSASIGQRERQRQKVGGFTYKHSCALAMFAIYKYIKIYINSINIKNKNSIIYKSIDISLIKVLRGCVYSIIFLTCTTLVFIVRVRQLFHLSLEHCDLKHRTVLVW